jgi:molecular chaperone GrpE
MSGRRLSLCERTASVAFRSARVALLSRSERRLRELEDETVSKHKHHEHPPGPADELAAEQTPPAEKAAAESAAPAAQADPAAALRAELQQAKDRELRAHAELENYRKRAHRQIEEERRYANLPLMTELLPVWDNVHRAIDAAQKTPDVAALLHGFRLVADQLAGVLAKHHCLPIAALHEPFDPHRHQAIAQQPSAEYAPNTVLLVTQEGFQLHDRVVRPSQVIVSTATE